MPAADFTCRFREKSYYPSFFEGGGTVEKSKKTLTSTKVVCAKCGKEYFVSFVADGHRDYYCDECLKVMHLDRKKGKVKRVFNEKTNEYAYEFVCDICETFRRATYKPKIEKGLIWCKECEMNHKLEERKKTRGKIVIASQPQSVDSILKKDSEEDDE